MSQSKDSNEVGEHSASEASGDVAAAPIASEDSGLLDVLRDLSATVKRLEEHIMTKTSASTTVESAHGKSPEQTLSQDHKYPPEGPPKLNPEDWYPIIDKLDLDELASVEARLFLPGLEESFEVNQLDTPLAKKAKSHLIEKARRRARTEDEAVELIGRISDTEILRTMWNPQLRIEEYAISYDEYNLVRNTSWFRARISGATFQPFKDDGTCIRETFSDLVSNADWSYHRPSLTIKPTSTFTFCYKATRGNGRSNFDASWISGKIGKVSLKESFFEVNEPRSHWLPVPYPAVPPKNIYLAFTKDSLSLRSFTEMEYKKFDEIIGKLWTIPPDGRLDLRLQHHVLKCVRPTIDIVDYVQRFKDSLQKLEEAGGLLQVTEFDDRGGQYTYQSFNCASASQVDEWLLEIAPKFIKVSRKGYPIQERRASDYTPRPELMNPWKRTVRIRGLTDVYADRFWDSTLAVNLGDPIQRDLNILFELHTTCSLKANEKLRLSWLPSIFHITWMETGFEEEIWGHHQSWIKQECPSLKGSKQTKIGNVAASPVKKYWTILALFPKSIAAYNPSNGTCANNFWSAIIQLITECLETATHSWDSIASFMEQFLPSTNAEQTLSQNGDFSVSERLFWIINKVDQILPMITDALEQWRWFSEVHQLHKGRNSESPPTEEGGLPSQRDLEPVLEQIRRLKACQRAFEALRERARSLRDGIFNLTSVHAGLAGLAEARESRLLAYNVKLLTYVTIFYLPLAFCTSMWAINDMFGTGTRGFAIITVLISSGTYAVVFGLLHQEYRQTVSSFLHRWTQPALEAPRKMFMRSLAAKKDQQSLESKQITTGQELRERQTIATDDRTDPVAGNLGQPREGKGKEPRTEELVAETSPQSLAKGRLSLINRFRGNGARGQTHKLSEIEEGGGSLKPP